MNTNKIEQYNALDIARWLVNQGITDERYMTNLALNKLAYFAHGFSYRINDVPLIDIRICPAFEAWKYGPVNSDIYHTYKGYGNSKIRNREKTNAITESVHLYLSEFWEHFAKKYSTTELVSMAHANNGAWHRARTSGISIIPEDYIKKEFKRK